MALNPLYRLVSFQISRANYDMLCEAADLEGTARRLNGTVIAEWIRQTLINHAKEVVNANEKAKATNDTHPVDPPAIRSTGRDRKQATGSTGQVDRKPGAKGTHKPVRESQEPIGRFSTQLFRLLLPDGKSGKRMTKKLLGQLAAEGGTSIENLLQTFRNHREFERVPGKPESENWWRVRHRRA